MESRPRRRVLVIGCLGHPTKSGREDILPPTEEGAEQLDLLGRRPWSRCLDRERWTNADPRLGAQCRQLGLERSEATLGIGLLGLKRGESLLFLGDCFDQRLAA